MPHEICPHCKRRFALLVDEEPSTVTQRDKDERAWYVVISDGWLAHRCEITTADR